MLCRVLAWPRRGVLLVQLGLFMLDATGRWPSRMSFGVCFVQLCLSNFALCSVQVVFAQLALQFVALHHQGVGWVGAPCFSKGAPAAEVRTQRPPGLEGDTKKRIVAHVGAVLLDTPSR